MQPQRGGGGEGVAHATTERWGWRGSSKCNHREVGVRGGSKCNHREVGVGSARRLFQTTAQLSTRDYSET